MTQPGLELWAGAECSMIRVRDRYVDQLALTGHDARAPEDVARIAELGAKAVRFPVVWERTAPGGLASADFGFADRGLAACRRHGLRPIVGLVHHGSGPRDTSLMEDAFVTGLAEWARVVAERYPWVEDFTPVNEPGTTARFSGLYGHWYPHARSADAYVRALLVEVLATRAAMRAIREVTPRARLVQTEDLGTIYATPKLAYQAEHENERRFLSLDLLTGRVDASHPLRRWLEDCGRASVALLDDLVRDPCPPDVVGINYYLTSDRFLDERTGNYPPWTRGGNTRDEYADVEAVRVLGHGICGHEELLRGVWQRYGLPIAITEAHLGCTPEEQIRWLDEAWRAAEALRGEGVDLRAVTAWSVFGAAEWNSLCVEERGFYEPGLFDVRGGVVRPTALARAAKELARDGRIRHPLAAAPGWWRREERIDHPMVGRLDRPPRASRVPPILVVGARGTLGSALVRALEARCIPFFAPTRGEMDASDRASVAAAIDTYRPWAVVNAAGDVRVDAAELDASRCTRENLVVADTLAEACASAGLKLVTFSSDLVFDGEKGEPYVESDAPRPRNTYGRSKALAERVVLARATGALVIRTAAFFGPWDRYNFVTTTLAALRAGEGAVVASDLEVSPTYVPDLAEATTTLLVDGAEGLFHLANAGRTTWAELAHEAARLCGAPTERIAACPSSELGWAAPRPRSVALASERASLMPTLEDALARYLDEERRTRAAG